MTNKWKLSIILIAIQTLVFFSLGGSVATKIKMVIIGDSMTMPQKAGPWPKILQELIKEQYEVINKAVNGRTLIAVGWKGNQDQWPYVTTKEWKQVFEEKPHMVTIMLGSNDTKKIHWVDSKGKERFKSDYLNMVDTLQKNIEAEPFSGDILVKPKIVLLYPPQLQGGECWLRKKGSTHEICDSVTRNSIIPIIREVAEEKGADTVHLENKNTNNLFAGRDDVYRDGLHFNDKGATEMAEFLALYFKEIKKEDFVGCTDSTYQEYSAKFTTSDPSKCVNKKGTALIKVTKPRITVKSLTGQIIIHSGPWAEIDLMDLNGELLRRGSSTPGIGFSLSTTGLPQGLYILRISTKRNFHTELVVTGR